MMSAKSCNGLRRPDRVRHRLEFAHLHVIELVNDGPVTIVL